MTTVFADTAYYIALLNPRDQHYAAATEFTSAFNGSFVTTAWVLVEVGNFLSDVANRSLFVSLWNDLQSDDRVRIVPATEDRLHRGLDLFAQRPDKAWSVTDCISFLVMQESSLVEALTTDRHFEQAGFQVLLK